MNKIPLIIIGLLVLMTIAGCIICVAFDTKFADLTIDWVSFIAGIFLIAEGLYKIFSSKQPLLRDQILRSIRVFIGTCVFTIHLLQFMRF